MFGAEIDAALISSIISLVGAVLSHVYHKKSTKKDRFNAAITAIEELAIKHWLSDFTAKALRISCTELQTKLQVFASSTSSVLDGCFISRKKSQAIEREIIKFRQVVTYDFDQSSLLGLDVSNPKIAQIKDVAHELRKLLG
jgi:hypothetical protein